MAVINPWVAIVTILSLLVYFSTSLFVARARRASGIAAPTMSGDPAFERAVRVQENTLEWLPLYLPSLWLFALFVNTGFAVGLGLVWIVGRILYMRGYLEAANKRSLGFGVQALATGVLLFGALIGAAWRLAQGGT